MRVTIWGNGWQRPLFSTGLGLIAIPRVGERIDFDGTLFVVTDIIWNIERETVAIYVKESDA